MGNSIINTGLLAKDSAYITSVSDQVPVVGQHIEFDTVVGNLPVSTGGGQANGLITLYANRKYVLEGMVGGAGTGGGSQYVNVQWYDVTNGVAIGGTGFSGALTYTTGDPVSQPIAKAVITPATNIQVELRITGTNNFALIYGTSSLSVSFAYIEAVEAYVPVSALQSYIRMTKQDQAPSGLLFYTQAAETVGTDITYIPDVVNGDSFLINISGVYTVSATLRSSAPSGGSLFVGVLNNLGTDCRTTDTFDGYRSISWTGWINAGEVVYANTQAGTVISGDPSTMITVARVR